MGVLALAMAGCNPDNGGSSAPDLLEPADGAVVSAAPVFVWSSIPFCDGYRIVIVGDSSAAYTPPFSLSGIDFSDPIIEKDRTDTTYTMSGGDFDNLDDGSYYWKVASLDYPPDGTAPYVNYSEVRSFVVEKAVSLGLDTTYFPFGLGYEWVYERYKWHYEDQDDTGAYDTVTIRVIDSVLTADGLRFILDRRFFDVDDTVVIRNDSVHVFDNHVGFGKMINLIPDSRESDGLITISYNEDTLILKCHIDWYPPEGITREYDSWQISRIKGVGAVYQSYSYYLFSGGEIYYGSRYRLLSFKKGGKTVWQH